MLKIGEQIVRNKTVVSYWILALLSFFALALVQTPSGLAITQAVLNVQSNPPGVIIANPTCYTVSVGPCGTTNWTSTKTGGIPTTIYEYPLTAIINGTNYTLSANSLTGCNQGTGGSKPNICKVSVDSGTTATISATYLITPSKPPFSACTANLVQNPSFESVDTSLNMTWGGSGIGWKVWQIKDTGTTYVLNWTEENPAGTWMFVLNGTYVSSAGAIPTWQPPTAFDGSKIAVMNGLYPGYPPNGAVNTLSTPTAPGATYEVSAQLATIGYPGSTTYDLRLRNSSTGAQSAPITQTVGQQTGNWVLLHGTVTDISSFDQVVVRYNGPSGVLHGQDYFGFVDDVHVCRVGRTPPWWQTPGALSGLVLGAITIIGLILVVLVFGGWLFFQHRRRNKAGGASKSSQVAAADFNNDGIDDIKMSDSQSTRLISRIFLPMTIIVLVLFVLGAFAAVIYIATAGGGVWKNISNPTDNNPTSLPCANSEYINDPTVLITCDSDGKVIEVEHAPVPQQQPNTPATETLTPTATPSPAITATPERPIFQVPWASANKLYNVTNCGKPNSVEISILITNVTSATLTYSIGGGDSFSIPMTHVGGAEWRATIASNPALEPYTGALEYSIQAFNDSNYDETPSYGGITVFNCKP